MTEPSRSRPCGATTTKPMTAENFCTLLDAYNSGRRLKTFCGLTPFDAVCKA